MPPATLSSKGQVVIPKEIRDRLGLRAGDRLEFLVQEGGDLVVRPAVMDVRSLKGMLHRPGMRSVPVEEMNRAIRGRRKGRL